MHLGSRNKKRPQLVTLYLMSVVGSDVYKIGYTTDINMRKYGIKSEVGSVKILATTYCDLKHEGILHANFDHKRASDGIYARHREYFRLSESDITSVLDYFKMVEAPPLLMDETHPEWKKFVRYLAFMVERVLKTCNHTHKHAKYYLSKCKQVNIDKTIDAFNEQGASCDCGILKIVYGTKTT